MAAVGWLFYSWRRAAQEREATAKRLAEREAELQATREAVTRERNLGAERERIDAMAEKSLSEIEAAREVRHDAATSKRAEVERATDADSVIEAAHKMRERGEIP